MGTKPNWGRFASSIGQSMMGYAEMKRQERLLKEQQEQELQQYDQRRSDRREDWLWQQQQKSLMEQQANAMLPPDPKKTPYPLPTGQFNVPFGGGNVNALGGLIQDRLPGLANQQRASGQPPTKDEFNIAMAEAQKRINKDKTAYDKRAADTADAEASSKRIFDRNKAFVDYKETLKDPELTVDEKISNAVKMAKAVGEVEVDKQEDIATMRARLKKESATSKLPTDASIQTLSRNALPKWRNETSGLGYLKETKRVAPEGSIMPGKVAEAVGEHGYEALHRVYLGILRTGKYGVGEKAESLALQEAIDDFNVPNERAVIEAIAGVRLDDQGTVDTSDDVWQKLTGESWRGKQEWDDILAADAKKAIMAAAKDDQISYKAAKEILEPLGLWDGDGYNQRVPNVSDRQEGDIVVPDYDENEW